MAEQGEQAGGAYRVLARKYRPQSFADLIGQEALVRTLKNAIDSGRIAQAYVLTGVRGVGKTTTARILAKALNYTGPDGKAGPTTGPTDDCQICRAIAEDRHVDVIEMDAASRTGVGDIRELIESVRYRPVEARYKVYIIDEVHMLSTSAFNALLKTLEEPPPHVVFIFATTEIRKVPVTVLSRCQRFDLRRIDQALLAAHFQAIAKKENVEAEPSALALIARAADGSARDGLSLMDQAIALTGGKIDEEQVRRMLGMADRARVFDLLEAALGGRAGEALTILRDLYEGGGDPVVILQDLLEAVHFITRTRLVPASATGLAVPENERLRGSALAETVPLPELARAWQLLLKGHGETLSAPLPLAAAEMAIIRLAHASTLPTPADLVRQLTSSGAAPTGTAPSPAPRGGGPRAALAEQAAPAVALPEPRSFNEVVALVRDRRETQLAYALEAESVVKRFEVGLIELGVANTAPADLAQRLTRFLAEATGRRWVVTVAGAAEGPTLRDAARAAAAEAAEKALQHPLAAAFKKVFPDAKLLAHRRADDALPPPAEDVTPPADEADLALSGEEMWSEQED